MRIRVEARYHLWLEKEVEAEDRDQATDKVMGDFRSALTKLEGYVDHDMEDGSASVVQP